MIKISISILYIRKDINQFWQKWNSKFSSKQCTPSVINGISGDKEIDDIFCDSFSGAHFDSYKDDSLFADFWKSFIVNFPQSPSLNTTRAIHYMILRILKKVLTVTRTVKLVVQMV